MKHLKISMLCAFCLSLLFLILTEQAHAQNTSKPEDPYTIENYYRVKWGYADEFILLWKKNHYPLLKKALEKGDILKITVERPRLHAPKIPGGISGLLFNLRMCKLPLILF